MNLSRRLWLSFGAVVALMLVMGVFAWRQMESLADVTEQLYRHPMAVSTGILSVEADMVRMHRSMKDVALAQAPEAVAKAKAAVDTYEGESREHMKLVKERFLGPKKLVEDIERCFAEWKPIRERVIALNADGKKDEAAAITKGEGAAKVQQIEAAITALRDWANQRAVAFHEDAQKAKAQAVLVFAALTLAAVLLAAGLAFVLIRSVLRQLGADPAVASELVSAVAIGDLNLLIPVREGDTSSLLARIREMQTNLSRIVTSVRQNADSVATASAQIAQGNQDLSQRTEQQASALQQTAASMEQLGSTVKQNADNARQANQLALGASEVAIKGGAVVSQVVDTMKGINDSSRRIADIIGTIDGIAFQTNILALNAAVEAARAGEQGRGFAVVASEVRNLAQRSAGAAKEIKELIGASVERVEQGSALVDQAGVTMTEVVDSIKRVTDIMGEISAASTEQSSGVAQVGEAVTQMDQATQQNAALVEQSAAAAESLKTQAQALVQAVAVFKTGATGTEHAHAGAPAAANPGWQGTERRGPERAKNVTRPKFGVKSALPKPADSAPPVASGARTGTDDWESF